jgi:hypothetical protein
VGRHGTLWALAIGQPQTAVLVARLSQPRQTMSFLQAYLLPAHATLLAVPLGLLIAQDIPGR